ncbi:MAG: hypothetical protein P1V13_13925 [Rhizobiaceae bacterium]|nr:hypothetical protein [Rhizobiaceae bacterium]
MVSISRSDNLHAAGQSHGRSANRRGIGGQIGKAGKGIPEVLDEHRLFEAVDRYGALFNLAGLAKGRGGVGGSGAQGKIEALEKAPPGSADARRSSCMFNRCLCGIALPCAF